MKYFPSKTISTIQPDIIYEEISLPFLDKLELKIQDFLIRKIDLERRGEGQRNGPLNVSLNAQMAGQLAFPTKFNAGASEAVKRYLLVSLESFKYTVRISGRMGAVAGGGIGMGMGGMGNMGGMGGMGGRRDIKAASELSKIRDVLKKNTSKNLYFCLEQKIIALHILFPY